MIELALIIGFSVCFIAVEVAHHLERKEWAKERQLLLERIQRPERIPAGTTVVPPRHTPERDPEKVTNYSRIGGVRPLRDDAA